MSTNPPSSVLNILVQKPPLDEQAAANNIHIPPKSVANGIMTQVSPVLRPTSEANYQLPTSNVNVPKTGANICPRCEKPVYFAEEIKAAGRSFHKICYKCTNCKKSINGANYSEHDGNLYDNNCYQRLFGPKGVGYGVGAGTLSTNN